MDNLEPQLPGGALPATPDPFHTQPLLRFRAGSYQFFELVDDLLHLGVAALLVIIAALVFVHILLTGLTDLDLAKPDPTAFFNVILNDINTILFVVIVLELLATVVAHLRDRTFALRPLLIIGIISSVRHILIVTAHMSTQTGVTPGGATAGEAAAPLVTPQIVELLVNGLVTVALVLCYWYATRAEQHSPRAAAPPG